MKKPRRAIKGRIFAVAPAAPALAIVVFAAAGAFAQGVSAGRTSGPPVAIEDVQVGEAGDRARVAIVCGGECPATARASGEFFLAGVASALTIDLKGRARFLEAITVTPETGGALLKVAAAARVERVAIRRCAIDSVAATCLDFEFAAAAVEAVAAADRPARAISESRIAASRPQEQAAHSAAAPVERTSVAGSPGLREAADDARLIFASLAPPERLAPPVSTPAVVDRDIATTLAPPPVDIAAMAGEILGRRFGVAECGGAEARLRADAWALDAMVDVGFCRAIDGDLKGADAIFARLLEYTPDNYEALIGRAAIAAREGERSDALEYFQEALNALPPIEESDRIVEAMAQI